MSEKKEIFTQYDYSKIDRRVNQIIKKTSKYLTIFDEAFIREEILKAYHYARDAHEGVFRLSWDPYIVHPVDATRILLTLQPDIFTIQACLLHDVAEDTDRTLEEIEDVFGKEVAFLCAWMEKLSKVRYTWEDRSIGSLRKMFIAMAEDLRVVFIKLSDRVHNMRTLKFHPKKHKRERIALETLNIYAPIADRLWLFWLKNNLEEECFKILHPKSYKSLKKELKELKESSQLFMIHVESEIESLLSKEWITNYKIDYRIKSMYSIYKKIQKKGLDNTKSLYDIFGIRVIVGNVEECYRVLGLIHNKWSPLPNRFKDYIALPKMNGYKSLHTTVMWLLKKNQKQPAEIQIKTFEMMEYAEIWVAAHYEYKEKWSKIAKDINWVKDLKDLTENLENTDFMTSLKIDVFNDRIFVFTPNGDSINLPAGSTAIDFAYHIHSELWDHISVAKVNSKVYPLDKELHNWDLIEIITDKSRRPNPFWLSFVKTTKAKTHIKLFLKQEDKDLHRERGREVMNRYLEKWGIWILDKDLTLLSTIDSKDLTIEWRWQLLEQVGNFSITPSTLMKRILRSSKSGIWKVQAVKKKTSDFKKLDSPVKKKKIVVWWDKNLEYKLCYCCRRRIPNQIVGHINSKSKITIHNRTCKVLDNVNRDRLLTAYIEWEEGSIITAKIKLVFENEIGILNSITQVILEMQINIEGMEHKRKKDGSTQLILTVKVLDYDYLLVDRLIERIALKLWKSLLKKKVLEIRG